MLEKIKIRFASCLILSVAVSFVGTSGLCTSQDADGGLFSEGVRKLSPQIYEALHLEKKRTHREVFLENMRYGGRNVKFFQELHINSKAKGQEPPAILKFFLKTCFDLEGKLVITPEHKRNPAKEERLCKEANNKMNQFIKRHDSATQEAWRVEGLKWEVLED